MKEQEITAYLQKLLTETFITVKQVEVQQGSNKSLSTVKREVIKYLLPILLVEVEKLEQGK